MDAALPDVRLIIGLGLLLGALFGMLVARFGFCTQGALSDLFLMGSDERLRMWLCAILVAVAGTALLQLGGVPLGASLYAAPRLAWLSHLAGGLCFGAGMTLASGCVSRNLVRLGGGNLKSLVVLLVVAVSAGMSLRGILALPRVHGLDAFTLDLPTAQTLPALLAWRWPALGQAGALALAVLPVLALLGVLALRCGPRREALLGGAGVGALVVAAWYVSGQLGFVAEHPETLAPAWVGSSAGRPEALSFVAPVAYGLDLLMWWSDSARGLSFGIAAALGAVLGGAAQALRARSWRLESFRDAADLLRHLGGAVLMGFGGVTAQGCSIGQGVSGLSLLSLGAVLTVAGIAAGAWLSLKLQYRLTA